MAPLEQTNTLLDPSSSSLMTDATIPQTDPTNTTETIPVSGNGGGQTLMDKLMAMRQGSTTAITANNINKMSTDTKVLPQVRHAFDPTSVDVIP